MKIDWLILNRLIDHAGHCFSMEIFQQNYRPLIGRRPVNGQSKAGHFKVSQKNKIKNKILFALNLTESLFFFIRFLSPFFFVFTHHEREKHTNNHSVTATMESRSRDRHFNTSHTHTHTHGVHLSVDCSLRVWRGSVRCSMKKLSFQRRQQQQQQQKRTIVVVVQPPLLGFT